MAMHLFENARFYIFTKLVKFTKVKFQRVSPAPPAVPGLGYKIYL